MRTRFIHAADIHLGYDQYNLTDRAKDFALAFFDVVDHAVKTSPEFLLLAGDLFHKSSADAWMMRQATHGLNQLRDAGIPVVAVEGNHDAQHSRKHLSWMDYLCYEGLLVLLNVHRAANGHYSLTPWDEVERKGSWIDVGGVRIYGIKYYGAMTGRVLDQIAPDLQEGPGGFTVLMLHAGMQGQVPHMHGGLTPGELLPLHPPVDYLALGHVHKRLQMDDWIYNPGSTEINSMEEIDWPHGFFEVEVDTARTPKATVTYVHSPHLRPFRRISINAEESESLEHFTAMVERRVADHDDIPAGAVIELHLGGVAPFKRQEVPVERLKGAVELRFSPLTVRVRNNLVLPGLVTVPHGERMRRAELERTVVEQLVYQNSEYRDRAAAWTSLVLDVKRMASEKDIPASIVDHVRTAIARMTAGDAGGEPVSDPPAMSPDALEDAERDSGVSLPQPAPGVDVAPAGIGESAPPLPQPLEVRKPVPDLAFVPYDADDVEGGEPPCAAPLFEDW